MEVINQITFINTKIKEYTDLIKNEKNKSKKNII